MTHQLKKRMFTLNPYKYRAIITMDKNPRNKYLKLIIEKILFYFFFTSFLWLLSFEKNSCYSPFDIYHFRFIYFIKILVIKEIERKK